jgi:hypothetical protein
MLMVGVPIVVALPEAVEVAADEVRPAKAKPAPAPAAATAAQISHFFMLAWLEYPPGELEMETNGSESGFNAAGFDEFTIEMAGAATGRG